MLTTTSDQGGNLLSVSLGDVLGGVLVRLPNVFLKQGGGHCVDEWEWRKALQSMMMICDNYYLE